MKAEITKENSTELEQSEIHTATSLDEEEREELTLINKSIYNKDKEELFFNQKSRKKEEIYSLDNKINPFSLSSPNNKIEKMIEKTREIIKYSYFILSCLCTSLDGFILIFIGYNTSILSRENKWEGNKLILIDIIYHLISALGGILSIFTAGKSNMEGLFYGLCITLIAFFASFYLIAVKNFFAYLSIFFIICISNGHIMNICTTQVVKKFTNCYRAAIYVFVYFFTQLGKFFFALILLIKNELISKGNIIHTVYPILIIISLQIICCFFMLFIMRRRKNMKESYSRNQNRRETIFNTIYKSEVNYQNNSGETNGTNVKKNFLSTSKIFCENFKNLLGTNWRDHTSNLVFLNLSLGIQFFSMINVFPLMNGKNTQVLVDEIFFSKTLHTIFLLFVPTIFLFKLNSRKFLLFMTFTMSLFLNVLIFLDFFNSSLVIHLFRFIWNVCYITVNLYCTEAATKRIRTVNTAFMYLVFKLSCIIEIITIDRLIAVSLYVPILLNIVILIGDMMLVSNLKVETHMKSIDEIEAELNDFGENKKFVNYDYNINNYNNAFSCGGRFNEY